MSFRRYLIQRITAVLMAPLIVAHLALILWTSGQGLTAADILSRTRGSLGWGLFYGGFVALAAVHGAIGVRGVAREWSGLRDAALDALMWGFGAVLLGLGLRAVWAVIA